MGAHAVLTQGLLQIVLASLSLFASHSCGSPFSDDNNKNMCPRGWYHYEQFCVTQGQGSSDRAVALYCDGFGGIGIKGLCIIKVHSDNPRSNLVKEDSAVNFSQGLPVVSAPNNLEQAPETNPVYATVSEDDSHVSLYGDSTVQDSPAANFLDLNVLRNDVYEETGLCPKGWTHYRSLCVYRPWSVEERCHLMNSVEFHGLCVKHADTRAATNADLEDAYSKEKRICCCASFKAKGNNYGC